MKRVTIIGGGLAGLIAAIELAHAGIHAILVERKAYPFHRVCGEYISNEVVPYLNSRNLFPESYNPPAIKEFQLSTIDGDSKIMPLDLGGFGISRYTYDNFLYERALSHNVEFCLNTEVTSVDFEQGAFRVKTDHDEWKTDLVIGSFGKRSRMDRVMNRSFLRRRSPYVGVKYHVRTEHPNELIALHNFPGGYCGISNIEGGKSTLCYLTHVSNVKRYRSIGEMEKNVLWRNPLLKTIFNESEFLFDKPEVINEVSFETKSPVDGHVLMAGDAAGMIAPLCGNGMAMAIQSARILTREAIPFVRGEIRREEMESRYRKQWNDEFSSRLWRGRQIQKLFGRELTSRIAVSLVMSIPPLARSIIRNTHGRPF
ncbi:NAD(P)/FAD-dependent oxidoreductase [Chryseolinea sp. T2]|uniref:NAD(P)/FAD-dependent oxidoreductase n=1 Tax=Chryseolinea sp. T2 TaxID=3129255 RepID=UPI00307689E7